ncbi:cytochrome P450 [Gilbertella persicaria]|uniref:cytochrome P450 n=1 Tax=Gilbertella persicaria TaxID=101096 RepID=UPI00221F59DC|nr:cytochrome P450 [Gilbertella persicaria]KAI8064291.1 cytochrome P450 [Gilbertella persicaria]
MTVSLIIALRDCESIEKDGHIVQIGHGANTDTVRSLAKDKLGLALPLDNIILQTSNGTILTEIEKVKLQQVVYIDLKEEIKDVIPGPMRLPMVGNLYDMMPDMPEGWRRQFEVYGNLASVSILGHEIVGTNDPAIAEIFVKESEYFTKKITTVLKEIKDFAGNGLFTSDSDDDEWKLAHKLLMPAFSPRAIKAYQPEMGKIAMETIKVLERYSPDDKVEILNWCTNLTFETIGRIGFGYSFDILNFDSPTHPFIEAMGYALSHAAKRFVQPNLLRKLPLQSNRAWENGNKLMHSIVEQVIQERKVSKDAKDAEKDLLGYMLNARDEHNLGLSDENIRDQVVTFLIAGHDTTANTLAWTFYELSRNPHVEAMLLQEIANAGITSGQLPTTEQISSLKYMDRVLKETLRLHPPLRGITKVCIKDCVVPGGYRIKEDTACAVSILNIHTNPDIYPDPFKYDPDRFLPEEEQNRSRYAWLPFSTGPRACIGMVFALQEAKTVLGMLLHRFKFFYDGPPVSYDPYQATTKPLDFLVNILPRKDFPEPTKDIVVKKVETSTALPKLNSHVSAGTIELPQITFLYGTQTGTSQDYAYQLSAQAKQFGFKDVTLCPMDQWKVVKTGKYQKPSKEKEHELLVICTATYNGQPPLSAEYFDKWITTHAEQEQDMLKGIRYAVFGVGNKQWRTYQAFPIKVDKSLDMLGAERCFSLGSGNVDGDSDGDFNHWCAHFWASTLSSYGVAASLDKSVVPTATLKDFESAVQVKFISPSDIQKWALAKENRNGVFNATVLVNRELQNTTSERSTRHLEIDVSQLEPIGEQAIYEPGDHIEILPENDIQQVEQIALGFGFVLDAVFELDLSNVENLSPRSLARSIQGPCTVRSALLYFADILSPPSRQMLSYFATQLRQVAPETATVFEKLIMPDTNNQDPYPEFIKKHRNLLDLQTAFPQVNRIDFGQFLAAVHVIQPRRYSIASSPRVHPTSAHISVAVVDDLVNDIHYPGLASSFLSRIKTQTKLRACLRSSKGIFSMPENHEQPLIMVAAGTGIAPFRGFLQEREHQKKSGRQIGPCILFFGCRHPDKDYLYKEEIEAWVNSGVLAANYTAFSRLVPPSSRKYTQHQLLANAAQVWETMTTQHGAVYVCGAGAMSRDVRSAFQVMVKSFDEAGNDQEAELYLQSLEAKKAYLTDVWG